jgi:hypothetical protein
VVQEIASRWYVAGEAEVLSCEEGEDWFERRQRMLTTSAELTKEQMAVTLSVRRREASVTLWGASR